MARVTAKSPEIPIAVRITLTGHVQGVGFRPFVYRLAKQLGVQGSVQNRLGQVDVIAIATEDVLDRFRADLIDKAPPLSRPEEQSCTPADVPMTGEFCIAASSAGAEAEIFVPPDYFMCDDCREELRNPDDRRFAYPFINCTQCGPRYTLIEALPYDRPNTSMATFPLCGECGAEYRDPGNRRFHAEPVACPSCGPRLTFSVPGEPDVTQSDSAFEAAVDALKEGRVVAVKGIGGYHLVCDARNSRAVGALRQRKHRPDKPLAVMFPVEGADGLDVARQYVRFGKEEADRVAGPVRPIVLARRRPNCALADNVAPGLAEIGVFLPYSPLHQLLLDSLSSPVVATSGNISGEPVLTDNDEASTRLADIADAFLHHDRPIVRPADDPVFRCIAGKSRPLRIGRGCAPRELTIPRALEQPLLAVGGHMKGTVALAWNDRVVVSPHIGEMDSPRSLAVFEQLTRDLQSLYGITALHIACDAHPGYTTHKWAHAQTLPVIDIWHHQAHASAVVAEVGGAGPWLMFTWDGVGLGEDGTLWGGDALLGEPGRWRRVASMRPFRLPGGERAGREPWRSAAALHWECGLPWRKSPDVDGLAQAAWLKGINTPETSAAGRLFDAASALICELPYASFEAQGPMALEALVRRPGTTVELPMYSDEAGVLRSDWQPLLELIGDSSLPAAERAEAFHSSMASAIVRQAVRLREQYTIERVGLCGGVFQNRVLTEQAMAMLAEHGFQVSLPEQLPCNDAALSFGQAAEVAARLAGSPR